MVKDLACVIKQNNFAIHTQWTVSCDIRQRSTSSFKHMNQLERLQRLRKGENVQAPLTL